jgi:hypothetical protein
VNLVAARSYTALRETGISNWSRRQLVRSMAFDETARKSTSLQKTLLRIPAPRNRFALQMNSANPAIRTVQCDLVHPPVNSIVPRCRALHREPSEFGKGAYFVAFFNGLDKRVFAS